MEKNYSKLSILFVIVLYVCFVSNAEAQNDPQLTTNLESGPSNYQGIFYEDPILEVNPFLEDVEKFQIDVWYGITFQDDANENGIRRADLKYQIDEGNQVYVYYDNALVLENKFLSSIENTAPIVGLGFKHDWSKKWFTKAEAGRRFLSLEDDQTMINLENVVFFSERSLGKLITQYDIRQNDDLLTLGLLYEYEIFKDSRLEVGFFNSENLTLEDSRTQRFLLTSKNQIKAVEVVAGLYYDALTVFGDSQSQFGGGFGIVQFPVVRNLDGKLFFNYNQGFFNNDIVVVAIGSNYKF